MTTKVEDNKIKISFFEIPFKVASFKIASGLFRQGIVANP